MKKISKMIMTLITALALSVSVMSFTASAITASIQVTAPRGDIMTGTVSINSPGRFDATTRFSQPAAFILVELTVRANGAIALNVSNSLPNASFVATGVQDPNYNGAWCEAYGYHEARDRYGFVCSGNSRVAGYA